MVEQITPPPLEALDVPPDNQINFQNSAETAVKTLKDFGFLGLSVPLTALGQATGHVDVIAWLIRNLAAVIVELEKASAEEIQPLIDAIIKAIGAILQPGMNSLGQLTSVYVKQFGSYQGAAAGQGKGGPGGATAGVAQGMYDNILAPLEQITGQADPAKQGAGAENAHFTLAAIVEVHLLTWMVNIISNLTGLGTLKFINSFNTVMTDALSARSVQRLAAKPYINKFISEPLERDLNKEHPLNESGASALVKAYTRGTITAAEFKDRMRGLGFREEVAEQLYLDHTAKPSISAIANLVKLGVWDVSQALTQLQHMGFPPDIAQVVLFSEINEYILGQQKALASELVSAVQDHRIDNLTLRKLLSTLDLTQDEINFLALRAATISELPRRPSLSQVKDLFSESLVDLDFVLLWLKEEGYDDHTADLLALLEFTKRDEREKAKADVAARRRTAADERSRATAARNAARLAAAQAAAAKLAAKSSTKSP